MEWGVTRTFLPVYRPDLSGNEARYVQEAMESTWISSTGAFLDRFRQAFGDIVGTPYVLPVCNGTVALHLALHCLDLQPGDEVIVPSFTYIASVNMIVQAGGGPVVVEVSADDWLLDPAEVERKITRRTRAIMPVHLYSAVCDMDRLCALARRHELAIVEDCAEALGATWGGRHVGIFSETAAFSFFGNKTITTGEGGMVITRDPEKFRKLSLARGQGMDPDRRYWHIAMGFNYRMTNVAAAIGVGQIERLADIMARKRWVADRYRERLAGQPVTFQKISENATSPEWLVSVLLPQGIDRNRVIQNMIDVDIETRPLFYCAHTMPHHFRPNLSLPISESISARGISLPSYPGLSEADIDRVCETLLRAVSAQDPAP